MYKHKIVSMTRRDPVEERASRSRDLYEVSEWEPRTALDRLATKLYGWGLVFVRWGTVLLALLITIFLLQVVFRDLQTESALIIGVLTILSAIPTFALAAYVYASDVTTSEPLELLVATFVLSVLFASFASVINTVFSIIQVIPFGFVLLFYLVVGPVEETVKLLSVRLYAYRKPSFNAVIDGAVYGAVAGLGFATIENVIYIVRGLSVTGVLTNPVFLQDILAGTDITATRALAGPGHVVYSAFAGYYLGLAKFNPERAGPIVVKGIIIAAFIHATYNTLIGFFVGTVRSLFPSVPVIALFFAFVLIYQGFFGYLLFRKISRYKRIYRDVHEEKEREERSMTVERTEFDG
jgi:RsiW-degrading membrane proteinase PrsW (M82 family)